MSVVNFTGLASGIDSSSIIASILDQRRTSQIKPLQAKISALTDTNSAFDTFKGLLAKVGQAADKFRDINGTVLSKNASSSSESKLTATASNSAANGSYQVNVLALAKNANASFADRYTSSTQAINSSINNGASSADRTVAVQVGTGTDQETVNVELTNTTSASDFVQQFNSSSTKAQASLVNVGTNASPSYAIVINSNNQGTGKGQLSISVGSEVTGAGAGALATTTLSQATDAEFTLSGISGTFTRGTNAVTDVVAGVTFNLQSTGSSTVTISDNAAQSATSIQDFVDAYNDVVAFAKENDTVTVEDSGKTAIFGTLSGTAIDEGVLSSLRSSLSSASISGGTFNTLADLGVTTQRDGTLKFDSKIFQDAVASDPENVRSITRNLGNDLGGVGGKIAQYNQFNGIIDTAQKANNSEIDSYNSRVNILEKSLSAQEESLRGQYSRLEAVIGKLNSQQSALSSLR